MENVYEIAVKAIKKGLETYRNGGFTAEEFAEHVATCCKEAEEL